VRDYSGEAPCIVQEVCARNSGFNLLCLDPGCSHSEYASHAQILEGSPKAGLSESERGEGSLKQTPSHPALGLCVLM